MVISSMEHNVPIYGNYHGYYTKRLTGAHHKDPRLAVLPPDLFEGKVVLDVGCNEGLVTCEIAQTLGARKVVGVDIDDTLVRAAWRRRRAAWSLQQPVELGADGGGRGAGGEESSLAEDETLDVVVGKKRPSGSSTDANASRQAKRAKKDPGSRNPQARPKPMPNYFPQSCEHEFGSLPVPPYQTRLGGAGAEQEGKHVFPHNLSFRCADWVVEGVPEDEEGPDGSYDIIVAFSISKWIHLNQGDEGLLKFFKKAYRTLRPGGVFILEPQPWDTYGKAKRMSEKLKENAKHLILRPETFEEDLLKPADEGGVGFVKVEHFGVVGEGGFRRPVDLYRKG